ncbi:hypothetical protein NMY22_g9971 [Coprinellus aureogranulatus]|nr:hypothetical protein NMY22_g9971 [Coprinellus aureogranulatus]
MYKPVKNLPDDLPTIVAALAHARACEVEREARLSSLAGQEKRLNIALKTIQHNIGLLEQKLLDQPPTVNHVSGDTTEAGRAPIEDSSPGSSAKRSAEPSIDEEPASKKARSDEHAMNGIENGDSPAPSAADAVPPGSDTIPQLPSSSHDIPSGYIPLRALTLIGNTPTGYDTPKAPTPTNDTSPSSTPANPFPSAQPLPSNKAELDGAAQVDPLPEPTLQPQPMTGVESAPAVEAATVIVPVLNLENGAVVHEEVDVTSRRKYNHMADNWAGLKLKQRDNVWEAIEAGEAYKKYGTLPSFKVRAWFLRHGPILAALADDELFMAACFINKNGRTCCHWHHSTKYKAHDGNVDENATSLVTGVPFPPTFPKKRDLSSLEPKIPEKAKPGKQRKQRDPLARNIRFTMAHVLRFFPRDPTDSFYIWHCGCPLNEVKLDMWKFECLRIQSASSLCLELYDRKAKPRERLADFTFLSHFGISVSDLFKLNANGNETTKVEMLERVRDRISAKIDKEVRAAYEAEKRDLEGKQRALEERMRRVLRYADVDSDDDTGSDLFRDTDDEGNNVAGPSNTQRSEPIAAAYEWSDDEGEGGDEDDGSMNKRPSMAMRVNSAITIPPSFPLSVHFSHTNRTMQDLLSMRRSRPAPYSDYPDCKYCDVAHAKTPFDGVPNDVLLYLFSFFSLQDFACFRAANIHHTHVVSEFIYNQCCGLLESFHIDKDDIHDFSSFWSTTRLTIITEGHPGPFALELVERFGFKLVEEGRSARKVCDELGFRFFGGSSPHFARLESRGEGERGPKKEILLVGTLEYGVSVVGVLTEFPTTLLMNFIAGDGYYSLYPKLTSAAKGYLNIPLDVDPSDIAIPVIEHLIGLHFEIAPDPVRIIDIGTHKCGINPSCPASPRLFPGPPMFHADFQYFRTSVASLSPVFFTLRSKSACGTELGPSRDRMRDSAGCHVSLGGKEVGTFMVKPEIGLSD